MIQKIKIFIGAHKIISVVILAVIVVILYFTFKSKTTGEVRYVTATVEKGSIISSISGTGQVEASNSIDLKAKSSGTITSVKVKAGAIVTRGQTLFAIDAQDAQKAVRDATLNLQIAQDDLKNAQTDFANTKITLAKTLNDLLTTLNSGANAVPDSQNSNKNIVTLSGSYNSIEQGTYTLEAYGCNNGACISYSGLESGSFAVDTNVPKALGSRGMYATFSIVPHVGEKWYIDIPSKTSASYATNLRAYNDKKDSLAQDIDTAERAVTSAETTVTERQNALTDAQTNLSNYYVTAPFDGTMATVLGKVGDIASATLGTIITKQKIASITLNEVDVSKVSLGQKVTLAFDAVDGLTITGHVAEIDGVGTVTQGVVSYTVKISLDTDDARVKPGMSVSASIITNTAQDVLTVPSSAVKTNSNGSYVEMFIPPLSVDTASGSQGSLSSTPPTQVPITTGISDDTSTQVISGLKEGDQIVSRTITTTIAKTATTAPSLFGGGTRTTGGNALRGAAR